MDRGKRMMTNLRIVGGESLPEAPYPADTRVNGWRFELDVERIKRSDTWVMASPEWRPWLLMVWMTAWDQRPAGSLPADHALIAAHIGMDLRVFSAHADILLRGFVAYRDGRLYHPVVVEQVTALLARREQERERKARWRSAGCDALPRSDVIVPRDRHGTDVGKTLQEQEQVQEEYLPSPNGDGCPVAVRDKTPFAAIVALWHEILPEATQPLDPKNWTSARKAQIRARWQDQLPDLDAWAECFRYCRESKFLMGQAPARPGRTPFRLDLFWLTKPENLLKLYEGKYHHA